MGPQKGFRVKSSERERIEASYLSATGEGL